jgi:RNA 3'-terminal phosphate cyclase (ATP)
MASEATQSELVLDGAHGEGGGQVVRTALSLAAALRRPVTITNVRAGRVRPGLQPQHLTAVRALAAVSDAAVEGAELHSARIRFVPRDVRGGAYRFDVGTAGAVSLILQALLLPLATAREPSRVALVGGTHVPWSPPFHYVSDVFLPAVAAMGVRAEARLRQWGWYPRGGGEVEIVITPTPRVGLRAFVAETPDARGAIRGLSAVAHLPRSIAERQRTRAVARLVAAGVAADIAVEADVPSYGPGTLVFLQGPGHAGFSALGRRGLPAEAVADVAVDGLLAHLASGAAIDEHLADQLVPFCALVGSESRLTCAVASRHLTTVAWVVEQFLPVRVSVESQMPARVRVAPR